MQENNLTTKVEANWEEDRMVLLVESPEEYLVAGGGDLDRAVEEEAMDLLGGLEHVEGLIAWVLTLGRARLDPGGAGVNTTLASMVSRDRMLMKP